VGPASYQRGERTGEGGKHATKSTDFDTKVTTENTASEPNALLGENQNTNSQGETCPDCNGILHQDIAHKCLANMRYVNEEIDSLTRSIKENPELSRDDKDRIKTEIQRLMRARELHGDRRSGVR